MSQPRDPTPGELTRLALAPEHWLRTLLDSASPSVSTADQVATRTFLLAAGCLQRFRAATFLLAHDYVEESIIVARSLQEDAARLVILERASPEKRQALLLDLWYQDLSRRRRMIDDAERSGSPRLRPIIERRRKDYDDEERRLTALQRRVNRKPKRFPRDANLVAELGPIDRITWASASTSSHSSWSPLQGRRIEKGADKVDIHLQNRETPRTVGLLLHDFGRWAFAAATAFEAIHDVHAEPTSEIAAGRWLVDIHDTLGERSADDIAEHGVPLRRDGT
jgi:hypothetical protein